MPDELIKHFAEWSSGFFSSEQFDDIILLFEKELGKYFVTRTVESNLIRIIGSIIDKVSFLSDAVKYPHHAEITSAIASNSNYLSDILVRNPESLYLLFSPEYLKTPVTESVISNEISAGLNRFKSLNAKVRYLRLFKRRLTLKIGVNDLLGNLNLYETTKSLSIVANAINRYLYDLCYKEVLEDRKLKAPENSYALMALGKHGGRELNYSSDIDLLLIANETGPLKENYNLDYTEIIRSTTDLFVRQAGEFTDLGNLYRVDFRLRPDGSNAPIVRGLLDTMNYYEGRGEQWERQMLIKLNFVGGDEQLFKQFASFVNSYVYHPLSFTSPLKSIELMKKNIEKMYNDDLNVKTTEGGIRDIEFSVQALQLIHAKKYKKLKTGNSLEALSGLKEARILSDDEYEIMSEAYIYYRRIEHYLQLMNNTQTHTIPANIELQMQLAIFFGFESFKDFTKAFDNRRKRVRTIFNSIINPDKKNIEPSEAINPDTIFTDKRRAIKNLEFLEYGSGLIVQKKFDSKTTQLFQEIKPALFKQLSNSNLPDNTLENFAKLIQVYKFTSIFYTELKNPKFLELVLQICEKSNLAINILVKSPSLVEDIISRKVFIKEVSSLFPSASFEGFILIISVQYTLELIDAATLSRLLCEYINYYMEKIFEDTKYKSGVFLAGLGSFGIMDMSLKSDADLLVVADNISKYKRIQEEYQAFLSTLQKYLAHLEIDFRLRPEGKSSPLVWDIGNYQNYLNNRAGVWEFQSLIKARFITGNLKLFKGFVSIVKQKIAESDADKIRTEIINMHKKITQPPVSIGKYLFNIKSSAGGLVTIDYIITYLMLLNVKLLTDNQTRENILAILLELYPDLYPLKSNYESLKKYLISMQMFLDSGKTQLPSDINTLNMIGKICGFNSGAEFESNIIAIFKSNMNLFNKILG